jgi:hypothetical protein
MAMSTVQRLIFKSNLSHLSVSKLAGVVLLILFFSNIPQANATTAIYTSTLSGDTTWSASNSPYSIYGKVIIPANVTLTIEPGTVLNFWGGGQLFLQSSGNLVIGAVASSNAVIINKSLDLIPGTSLLESVIDSGAGNPNGSSLTLGTIRASSPRSGSMYFLGAIGPRSLEVANSRFEGFASFVVQGLSNSVSITNSTFVDVNNLGFFMASAFTMTGNVFDNLQSVRIPWGPLYSGGTFTANNNYFLNTTSNLSIVDDTNSQGKSIFNFQNNFFSKPSGMSISRSSNSTCTNNDYSKNYWFGINDESILRSVLALQSYCNATNTKDPSAFPKSSFSQILNSIPDKSSSVASYLSTYVYANAVPVNTSALTIFGTQAVGESLTALAGSWNGNPTPTFTFSWYRCDSSMSIAVSTEPSGCAYISSGTILRLTSAEADKFISIKISAINSSGTTTVWSASTNAIFDPSLSTPLIPTFVSANPTTGGFTLQISNYDSNYTWSGTNSAGGTVTISGSGLVTVSGLAPSATSTVTIRSSRSNYANGIATSTSIISGPLTTSDELAKAKAAAEKVLADAAAAAKAKADAEAAAKAKLDAEAKAASEAKAAAEALAKAKLDAEAKAKAKIEADAKAAAEVAVKAKLDAEVKAKAEAESALAKAVNDLKAATATIAKLNDSNAELNRIVSSLTASNKSQQDQINSLNAHITELLTPKPTTIVCAKGTTTKTVKGINPVCPVGYKKK